MRVVTEDQLDFILESAVLAPSADNHHRFSFRIAGQTVHVDATEGPLPGAGGYKRVLALLSLGAMSENFTIAASRFGLGVEAELLPESSAADCLLRLRLHPDGVEADPLWHAIPLRHTSRQLRFRGPALADPERQELDTAAHAVGSPRVTWLTAGHQRDSVIRMMRRAETERFRSKLLHEELFSAIRFDLGWHAPAPQGLPPGALAIEAPLRPLFAMLRHWPVMRAAQFIGLHHILGFRSCELPCRLSPELGLITAPAVDSQSVFDAGRAFQRVWLAATKQGRALQPMPASALYALEGAHAEGIPERLQRELATGWKSVLDNDTPLILFRMGRASTSPVHAGRLPTATYRSL